MAATQPQNQPQRRTSAVSSPAPPFDALRQRLGLSITEFAAVLGAPYSTVYGACHGLSLMPRTATAALYELGICPEALAAEQRQWLIDRGAQRRAKLRAQLEAEEVKAQW